MDAAVYDLPFASLPTRKPRTPAECPIPDFEKFSRSGPSLRLRRNRQAIACQVYRDWDVTLQLFEQLTTAARDEQLRNLP
jgi:hypothetical protein